MIKIIENLARAEEITKKTGYLLYMTYPLVKDKKILIRILSEQKRAITQIINSILQLEHSLQRIRLFEDPKANFETFELKCSERYEITKQEINKILELFLIIRRQEECAMEFIRDEKLIFLSEKQEILSVPLDKIKEFQNLAIKILEKTKISLNKKL
jgi:hypothetical protein